MKKIWQFINKIITSLWECFSTDNTFHWFVIAVIGIMLRSDTLGVSSIIRELSIRPELYQNLLNFFHSPAWDPSNLAQKWLSVVHGTGMVVHEDDKPILIGDGVKQNKESSRMPCVKRMRQESEDTSKPEHIIGHMFGALGILIGNGMKNLCLPISMTIQDGCRPILEWLDSEFKEDSHVQRLVREACKAAITLRKSCYLLMDRAFLSVPALEVIAEETRNAMKNGLIRPPVTLITKAKSNAVAFETPKPKYDDAGNIKRGRGRPRIKGDKVTLYDLFERRKNEFITTELEMYGKLETVKYLCVDLLWGDGLYQPLRFVLTTVVGTDIIKSILISTDITLEPLKIIKLYCRRFSIESCFRVFKQFICGFGYHFWSRLVPPLKKNMSAQVAVERLANVSTDVARSAIIRTYNAIEGFVMISCIALGLLQLTALIFSEEINNSRPRWLRTFSKAAPSEETTALFLVKSYSWIYRVLPNMAITEIIKLKKIDPHVFFDESHLQSA